MTGTEIDFEEAMSLAHDGIRMNDRDAQVIFRANEVFTLKVYSGVREVPNGGINPIRFYSIPSPDGSDGFLFPLSSLATITGRTRHSLLYGYTYTSQDGPGQIANRLIHERGLCGDTFSAIPSDAPNGTQGKTEDLCVTQGLAYMIIECSLNGTVKEKGIGGSGLKKGILNVLGGIKPTIGGGWDFPGGTCNKCKRGSKGESNTFLRYFDQMPGYVLTVRPNTVEKDLVLTSGDTEEVHNAAPEAQKRPSEAPWVISGSSEPKEVISSKKPTTKDYKPTLPSRTYGLEEELTELRKKHTDEKKVRHYWTSMSAGSRNELDAKHLREIRRVKDRFAQSEQLKDNPAPMGAGFEISAPEVAENDRALIDSYFARDDEENDEHLAEAFKDEYDTTGPPMYRFTSRHFAMISGRTKRSIDYSIKAFFGQIYPDYDFHNIDLSKPISEISNGGAENYAGPLEVISTGLATIDYTDSIGNTYSEFIMDKTHAILFAGTLDARIIADTVLTLNRLTRKFNDMTERGEITPLDQHAPGLLETKQINEMMNLMSFNVTQCMREVGTQIGEHIASDVCAVPPDSYGVN